jgi:hypothetical protein
MTRAAASVAVVATLPSALAVRVICMPPILFRA